MLQANLRDSRGRARASGATNDTVDGGGAAESVGRAARRDYTGERRGGDRGARSAG